MFASDLPETTPGRMDARKQLRLHRRDEKPIRAAASTIGLQGADFIWQSAVLHVEQIGRRISLSVLPAEAFEAFRAALDVPGRVLPGPAATAAAWNGLFKDMG
ncbi:hypothetical protein [Puniceibacterium sediminis]|uniref:Uncharacterized conserved protein, DUF1778 family n=1 Tax=Puniceibacterium sediminis TaxID=1608407 RepID=A0A238YAY7_9RHOB|nr:hypothetical protein [Puniceibacterium sediminis]SNR67921.1 Uncharacterized conserved protein, DUF1778 family [Puniceibacterium sediminis]